MPRDQDAFARPEAWINHCLIVTRTLEARHSARTEPTSSAGRWLYQTRWAGPKPIYVNMRSIARMARCAGNFPSLARCGSSLATVGASTVSPASTLGHASYLEALAGDGRSVTTQTCPI